MIKAVIFDMDGLMLDTEVLLNRFWRQASRDLGFEMKPYHPLAIRSMCRAYAEGYLKRELGEDFDYSAVRTHRIELMNAYLAEHGIPKKKGLDELLDWLCSEGIKAAVCTATDLERTRKYLTEAGVLEKFDELICGNMVKVGKPAPYIYLNACEKIGLPPCECMALEDSPNGVISAAVAGLNVVMIPDQTQPSDDIKPLLYGCCESLDKVIDLLKKDR